MPMDEVPTEEVASQQQTLAVAEGPLQDMTVTCKQSEVTFVFMETASKNSFQDSPSGPRFKTANAWTMCEG